MSYTSRAEALADLGEIVDRVFDALTRCHAAGLQPDAVAGLYGAFARLAGEAARARLPLALRRACGQAWTDDVDLVDTCTDLEDTIARTLKDVDKLMRAVAVDHARGLALAGGHDRNLATTGRLLVADCAAAGEILAPLRQRLTAALACVQAVPEQLGDTYEDPYSVVTTGHVLPHHGRFFTGT